MNEQALYSLGVIALLVIAYVVHSGLHRNTIRFSRHVPAKGDSADSYTAGISVEKELEWIHVPRMKVQTTSSSLNAVDGLTAEQKEELERLKQEYSAGVLGFNQYKAEKFRIEGNAPYLLQPKERPHADRRSRAPAPNFTAGGAGRAPMPNHEDIARMTGVEFEHYCSQELRKRGWTTTVTKASGDQGLDILAERDGKKVAIQCKRYTRPIGNSAVQEIHAAKSFYDADYAVVAGSSAFMVSAQALARKLDVQLLHHTDLKRLHIFL